MNIVRFLLSVLFFLVLDIFVYPYQIKLTVEKENSKSEYIIDDENNLEISNTKIIVGNDAISISNIKSISITKKRVINPQIKKIIPYESKNFNKINPLN